MNPKFHGIAVFEIIENGNILSGCYTNTVLNHTKWYDILSELSKKKTFDNKGVEGLYECTYVDWRSTVVFKCALEIVNLNGVYEFKWKSGTNVEFEGIGMKVGNNHITVSYIEP